MNEWVKVSERMPKTQHKVIVFFKNRLGIGRRTMANYVPPFTVRADSMAWDEDTDSDFFDVDEKDGVEYMPAGWWEDTITGETMRLLNDQVTHWMPLPKPPSEGTP